MLASQANARGLLASVAALRPQDVFATSLYTGTRTTQKITNGLNLAGNGGLVWAKRRQAVFNHVLIDSIRGRTKALHSSTTDAEVTTNDSILSFNSDGFTLGGDGGDAGLNFYVENHVAWSFRCAPKFFDTFTYTGDGTSGRQIPHGLGIAPGMIVIKIRTQAGYDWIVWHRGLSANSYLKLNSTAASTTASGFIVTADANTFTIGVQPTVNTNGESYVVELYAHDPDTTNGIIQCGSASQSGGNDAVVTLDWRPQFVMVKCTNSGTQYDNWHIVDSARGFGAVSGGAGTGSPNPGLDANRTAAETSMYIGSLSNGFNINDTNGGSYIYLAIRAPI